MLAALLLAVGLAMDAVAAAAVRGMTAAQVRARDAARLALLAGGFQSGMLALGWAAGDRFGSVVARRRVQTIARVPSTCVVACSTRRS